MITTRSTTIYIYIYQSCIDVDVWFFEFFLGGERSKSFDGSNQNKNLFWRESSWSLVCSPMFQIGEGSQKHCSSTDNGVKLHPITRWSRKLLFNHLSSLIIITKTKKGKKDIQNKANKDNNKKTNAKPKQRKVKKIE